MHRPAGPVLFCFERRGLEYLRRLAAEGNTEFQQLELDMFRLGGLFLLERLRPQYTVDAMHALRMAAVKVQPPAHVLANRYACSATSWHACSTTSWHACSATSWHACITI